MTKTVNLTKPSRLWQVTLYGDKVELKKQATSQQAIRWLDLYYLNQQKAIFKSKLEDLTKLQKKYLSNDNLTNLINRKIDKLTFYFKTYCQQVFDLTMSNGLDSQSRYNLDLLHFDLFIKNQNLSDMLLYYRQIDIAKKSDFDKYIFDSDFVKCQVFDKTEKNIINKVTNAIILEEIAKNDKVKLDFIKIYQKNINKYWHSDKDRKTISRYKKYLIDRYSYLLSD